MVAPNVRNRTPTAVCCEPLLIEFFLTKELKKISICPVATVMSYPLNQTDCGHHFNGLMVLTRNVRIDCPSLLFCVTVN
jgi:hypothetical protein